MGGSYGALPMVGRPPIEDGCHPGQFPLAVEPSRDGHQLVDEILDRPAEGYHGALVVDDDLRVEAVPRRSPLVLAYYPALGCGQRVALVECAIEPLDQTLRERCLGGHLVQGGQSIADPELYGTKI